ncbi:MAG TPA: hypothetical protein VN914_12265, partial [Polyangia bacterium]|nr:hypothetical protein [Polyangia bacterium]
RLSARTLVPLATAVVGMAVLFPQHGSLLPFRALFDILYLFLPLIGAALAWSGYVHAMASARAVEAQDPRHELATAV